ncbi:MAG: DNA topoisomerase (ATP-hydrolyzing) subunit B [Fusobacteriota bacterium]
MSDYSAKEITVLKGLEAVRKRPGMYIGSTSLRGLHHLIWEVVDNSVDEALAGHCTKIDVKVLKDNIIEVQDNGRGIPVENHDKEKKSALELVMTVLHAGGKFENKGYKVSGGLHGVGVSVVNALSSWLEVEVKREGKIWFQRYQTGIPEETIKVIGEADSLEDTGTKIKFKPDSDIFEDTVFECDRIIARMKELAYLNRGLKIDVIDERKDEVRKESFEFEGGIEDFIRELEEEETKVIDDPIYMEGEEDGVEVEVAALYVKGSKQNIFSFVNNINTHEGGTHVSGFKSALTRTVNDVARSTGMLKEKDDNFLGRDVREGIITIINIKVPEPQFEGQTKTKLGNSEITGIVSSIVSKYLKIYLEDHPDDAKEIINKIWLSKKAREAAKKARNLVVRKSALEVSSLPGKLADCASKDADKSEVFIVEGDSAGGSAKQGRNREFQAILPLKGKILNVEKSGINRALENDEIRAMITAFGVNFGEDLDMSKLRYSKIIIMTDADVDGAHIRTLILTFFFRHYKELIENGNIYIAQPPLYKIQQGRKSEYAYTEKDRDRIVKNINGENYSIQRYKGLGEMNPEQLWSTTLDPSNRRLLQVKMEDATYADQIFSVLMGGKVKPRRDFIQEHADKVRNLDI